MQTTAVPKTMPSRPAKLIKPATRGARLMAAIIDSAIGVLFYLIATIVGSAEVFLVGIISFGIYQIYLLSSQGQTVGKQLAKIRIVKADSDTNGGFFSNVLMRLILNGLISIIPFYALIDILFIFRRDRRCIHDMIAGTKVISVDS